MNFFTEYPLFSLAAEALGLTILHSLWQGFLLLFLLAIFLRFGKRASSNTRFAVALVTLLMFLAAFGGTLYLQWTKLLPPPVTTLSIEVPTEAVTVATENYIETTHELPTVTNSDSNWETGVGRLTQLAPWLAWLWVIGSFVFALRLVNGFVQSQRLRYRTQPISSEWQQRAQKLSKRLGINQTVLVASTNRSSTPLTLGWIKPVVLIPTSLLTMMPANHLEAILIHELAHIKRHDYLWNLIQSVAEVVLFYHPAYWYISSVLERERELACDHLTVNTTRQPRIYAQALLQIATQATQVPLQSVAASGKRGLSNRIQQLIHPGRTQRGISVLPFLLLLSIISLSLAAFSWYQPELNSPEDNMRPPDYIDYGNIASQMMPLSRHLAFRSKENYLIGHSDFSRKEVTPRQFFRENALYLLDGNIVDDPNSIKLNAIRRLEVYYDPLPAPLQNLTDRKYSAVVRVFSREYEPVDDQKPFSVSGQITTQEEGKVQPVPGVRLEIKESGKQVVTDEVGKFSLPATPDGTLVIHWPNKTVSEREINGQEFFHLIAYTPKRRAEQYWDKLQKRLVERMSETALEKDREAIQQEINALDKAINSLQEYKHTDTLTKVIRGRVMDAYANQGIEGATIKASDGSTAITDAQGYYKIHLPIRTTNTIFEFAHPDYDTQQAEVSAALQEAIYLSMFKEENQLIIRGDRIKEDEKIIQGKVFNSSNKEGIANVVVKASNGTTATTDELGNYQISLPSAIQQTVFEFTHSDYATRTVEVNPHLENEIFISISKDNDDKSVIKTLTKEGLKKIREERKVGGKIVDTETNEPIPNVAIRWTRDGEKATITRTNEQGEYQLTLPKDVKVVEYAHPDYQEHFMRDEWITWSFSIIIGLKKLKAEPDNEINRRKGPNSSKFEPVDLSQIRSNSAEQSPLYIIDGLFVEYPFKNLDASNVKHIEVVKSPEAEKRYGERAQHGAVLITTKNSPSFKTVEGRITDRESGKPLKWVYVRAKGTIIGTETDLNGKYRIKIPRSINSLEVSADSYVSKTVAVKNRQIVNASLLLDPFADLENALFVINGQVREDIRTFEDIKALNLDIKYTETFKGNDRWRTLPKKYLSKGYNKVFRVVTEDYQLSSVDRTAGGKLIDARTGKPLVGAEINWMQNGERTTLTRTNEQGEYKVTLPEEVKVIEYSYPGYTPHVIMGRYLVESFPMRWTLRMRKKELTDRSSNFNRQLFVSPNPSDDEINVKFTLEEPIGVEFELLDKEGNMLHSVSYHYSDAGTKEVTVPTVRFPANVYLLRVKSGDLSFTRRIILE